MGRTLLRRRHAQQRYDHFSQHRGDIQRFCPGWLEELLGRLTIDGVNYTSTATDASFTLSIAPGPHSARFYGNAAAVVYGYQNSQLEAQLAQKYRIEVSSVPEPAVIAAGAVAFPGLLRRRRAARNGS